MEKKVVYIPVSTTERLPNETNQRYGVIIDGSNCIDSSVFTLNKKWSNMGFAEISYWLEPQEVFILTEEEMKAYQLILKQFSMAVASESLTK